MSAERSSRHDVLGLLAISVALGCRASPARTVVYGAARAPGAITGSSTGASDGPPAAPALSGSLTTRYTGRWGGGDDDHDLSQVLDASYDDAAGSGLSGSVLAQFFWDIGGSDPDSAFYGLQDTYDGQLTGRLYHAYVDVHGLAATPALRIGRQEIHETPVSVYFDGLSVETSRVAGSGTRLGAYGGIPTQPYESSSSGDVLLGLYALTDAWPGGRLRTEWMHVEDESLTGEHADDLLGVRLDQTIDGEQQSTSLGSAFTALDGEERDLRLLASHYDAEHELTLDASFYELFETQRDLAVPLDPFYSTLYELFPYTQLTLSSSKAWEDVRLQGGLDVRRVSDAQDVGQFNHDFERYTLTGTLTDLLARGAALGLTGEVWDSDDSDVQTWGLDLSRAIEERWDVSLGSYYSLFKYDYYLGEERDHVRTYYTHLRYRRTESLRWSLSYEFEDNDFDDYQRLRLGLSWLF